MKTDTRDQILKLIENSGQIRPEELRRTLNLTPQTIHYHLRNLSQQGLIQAKGSVPHTRYSLAGVPSLDAVSHWIQAPALTESPAEMVCETREILAARLPRLQSFRTEGLPEKLLPLVISTAGEIGNNSFDHNLGQWRDVPGCWFESQTTGKQLWICIADRGQGVFKSLAKVHPKISDDQSALKAAFETIISGRSPEQRGNGLKFVRATISSTSGGGLACISGSGQIYYGDQGKKCATFLEKHFREVRGTITLMVWGLQ